MITVDQIPFLDVAHHQLIEHPAPWTIEEDWTIEVHASDGHIVAKCQSYLNAEKLVKWAEQETKEMDDFEKLLDSDPNSLFDKNQ